MFESIFYKSIGTSKNVPFPRIRTRVGLYRLGLGVILKLSNGYVIYSIIPVIFGSKQVLYQNMIYNKYTLAKKIKGNNSQIVDDLSDGTKIVAL